MLYPSIDKLLDMVDSKYTLVIAAAKRARHLNETEGAKPYLEHHTNVKNVGIALEEIYQDELVCKKVNPEDLED